MLKYRKERCISSFRLQVKLDLSELGGGAGGAGYDDANALVLPSEKRATKVKVEHKQNVKILTKKQRKHLQAIVDKKKKKEGVSRQQACQDFLLLMTNDTL